MTNIKILGFHRVGGFDHAFRVVTNEKNQYGQSLVAYKEGHAAVTTGYMFAPQEILNDGDEYGLQAIESATWEEIRSLEACIAHITSMTLPSTKQGHVVE